MNSTLQILSMTSREIAALTGKRHDNVVRDIRVMFAALEEDASSFEEMSEDSYGRAQKIFRLPKDLTLTVLSGYSVVMRYRVVTRWQELEASVAAVSRVAESSHTAPIQPQTYLEALRAMADVAGREQVR
ncbi:MAG: hypothetical protein EOP38_01685 [Rubrivivax sp.]|nr:MAG: hypothetical protein EOP38_01685 [Rubrivivax sp.]